jgi:hypothetical protein
MLWGSKQKMHEICGDTVSDGPKGPPYFLLARDQVGNSPIGSPLFLGHFPKCIRYSVSYAEKSLMLYGHSPKSHQHLLDTANGLQELLGAFPYVSQQ